MFARGKPLIGQLARMVPLLGTSTALLVLSAVAATSTARETFMPVDPARPNTVKFEPVEAKFVRFVIDGSSQGGPPTRGRGQPCIDELEIFAPGKEENLAAADRGSKATASSCLAGYTSHKIEHLSDGQYGNDHSWILAGDSGWAQIELPEATVIDRVVFSRDRNRQYADRIPLAFAIQVSADGRQWATVKRCRASNVVVVEAKHLQPNRPIRLDLPPLEAKYVRLVIRKSNGAEPCVDELEIFGADPKKNLALASTGAKATASSCLEGYAIHKIEHLNDGKHGNEHSWIAGSATGWAQIELPEMSEVRQVVFSRDRDGTHRRRLATDFEVQLSSDGKEFFTVRKIVAMTGGSIDRPTPDETPQDWAWRVVEALPEHLRKAGESLLADVKTEADVQSLLDLHRLDRRRKAMAGRLDVEFNPPALRRAVADLAASYPATHAPPEGFERQLAAYEKQLPGLKRMLAEGNPAETEPATALCEEMFAFSRAVLMANPLLDFEEILLLKRKTPGAIRNDVYWQWGQQYGMTVNWSCDFRPKNPPVAPWWDEAIVAASLRDRQKPARTIFKAQPTHMIQHPDLHFDARRILFAMPGPDGAFQVFEVGTDGKNLRQITTDTGPDVDNGDPCYLPASLSGTERIIFDSTRMYTGVPCEDGQSYVANLCITDLDGQNTRILTFDQESNWYPTLLNSGRVLYTRYEYANISHQFGRLLFSMNPDGTGQMEYYGSNSYWPNSIFYARPIPNHPTMVAGVVCGHHGPNRTGRLVLFDPARGRRETSGAVQTIPGWGKPVERIVEDELYGRDYPKFVHPWPLSEKYFLVSARIHPQQVEYGIYLVDVFDNVTEVGRVPDFSLLEPIPLKPRERPPVIPDRIKPGAKEATVYLANVYRGPGLMGVPRGKVKRLRLFSYSYMYRDTIRRGFGHLATVGADGPWEPRYILGTVPVAEDGSALFRVPANVPISVQPLDEEGRALQLMRSWFTAMPGEVLSCAGCHEQQNTSPPSSYSLAALGRPETIQPWRGPARGFDFELEVQPLLDKYCVGCHDGSKAERPDFARKTAEEKLHINAQYHRATESLITTTFTPAFIALHPYVRRPHAESNYGVQVAAEYCVDTSPLIQMLKKGHHNVKLDREAWDRLYTWIDLGVPDQGSWENSEWGSPGDYYQQRLAVLRRDANRHHDVEWMPAADDKPVEFIAPEPESPAAAKVDCPNWPFDSVEAVRRQEAVGLPKSVTLGLTDGLSMDFVLVPPGEFMMGDPHGAADERGIALVRIEEPFYMSRHEVTNAQFAALVDAGHFSGHVGWRSIDWRGEGYSLFQPHQPVVRVTWHRAMAFCRALSAKTGKPVTLPTEAQWEWACRAGADSPLWYGGPDDDFGSLENLAGRESQGFAFSAKRKWHLRDDRFDDGAMVTAKVGSYRANPWGLHDMAGNVSEWTLSAFGPYPYDAADGRNEASATGEKVVRGGSWYVRPVQAGSAYRWKYPAWQKVFNVGFRVVVKVDR